MVVKLNLCPKAVSTPYHTLRRADTRKKQSVLSASVLRREKDASLEAWRQRIDLERTFAIWSRGKRAQSVANRINGGGDSVFEGKLFD
jgi:hypothetical protein